jgi:hypothetical protein
MMVAGASPLPTLEGDSYQSPCLSSSSDGKRDGIYFEESVVIFVGDTVWSGWVFWDSIISGNYDGNIGKRSRGLWIEGVREWPGGMDMRQGCVAILDLAGECLDCSKVIIHLRNELGETRILPSRCARLT